MTSGGISTKSNCSSRKEIIIYCSSFVELFMMTMMKVIFKYLLKHEFPLWSLIPTLMPADLTFCSILLITTDIYLLSEDSVVTSPSGLSCHQQQRLCLKNSICNLVRIANKRMWRTRGESKLNCALDPIGLTMHPIKLSLSGFVLQGERKRKENTEPRVLQG